MTGYIDEHMSPQRLAQVVADRLDTEESPVAGYWYEVRGDRGKYADDLRRCGCSCSVATDQARADTADVRTWPGQLAVSGMDRRCTIGRGTRTARSWSRARHHPQRSVELREVDAGQGAAGHARRAFPSSVVRPPRRRRRPPATSRRHRTVQLVARDAATLLRRLPPLPTRPSDTTRAGGSGAQRDLDETHHLGNIVAVHRKPSNIRSYGYQRWSGQMPTSAVSHGCFRSPLPSLPMSTSSEASPRLPVGRTGAVEVRIRTVHAGASQL